MQLVIDTREHSLIEKLRSIQGTANIAVEQLLLGDALIRTTKDILLFERKSLTDLLASIKDGRYEEQSHRIIHTSGLHPHNVIYVVEGVFSTLRNPADKKIILSAMTSLSYFKGFSVFRTATVLETAELILAMANKLEKEFAKGRACPLYADPQHNIVSSSAVEKSEPIVVERNEVEGQALATEPTVDDCVASSTSYSAFVKKAKRDNITPENIGEIFLSQIPGISSHIAQSILSHFDGSFLKLVEDIKTHPEKLNAICVVPISANESPDEHKGKARKLSKTVIQSILLYLREKIPIKDMDLQVHISADSVPL